MFTISVRLQTAALPTAVLAPCSTRCSNCTQWLWKNLQVSYLHSIKCNFYSCLRSWRYHQYQIGQLLQPDEEEMSDFKIHINRTWRGYLVRDVDIKNKSTVSWFCFLSICPLIAPCCIYTALKQQCTKTERRLPYSTLPICRNTTHGLCQLTAWRPRSYPEIVTSQYLWDEQGPEPSHLNATCSGSCRSSQTLLSQHAILSKWMLNTMGGIELLAKEAFESKMLASLNKLKRECSLRRREFKIGIQVTFHDEIHGGLPNQFSFSLPASFCRSLPPLHSSSIFGGSPYWPLQLASKGPNLVSAILLWLRSAALRRCPGRE